MSRFYVSLAKWWYQIAVFSRLTGDKRQSAIALTEMHRVILDARGDIYVKF